MLTTNEVLSRWVIRLWIRVYYAGVSILFDAIEGCCLKSGEILKKFYAKDGRTAILRTPRLEDLDDLLELINSLVEEQAQIYITEKVSRENETKWLLEVLKRLENNEQFLLVIEVDKKVVGSADFQIHNGPQGRFGPLGIVIRNGYRNLGIGTEIMKSLLDKATYFGVSVTVNVLATNKRAIHVYEKVGFTQSGIIAKKHCRQGKLIDEIVMINLKR